ncbi:MAG: glycoside hydrolase family 16 protein, partial [Propionibacteriaceae bacterium]|nr:glycoside hydrolase family 16 protein [Propionibacteriaceae bacterium]
VGSVITLTVNGTQVWTWTDNYASAPRNVLASGPVGWSTIGATATINNFTVTSLAQDQTLTSASISPIKTPVAGLYPQGLYKSNRGLYTETLVWSPAIATTFATNTVYTVTDTLTPVSPSTKFSGVTKAQISGLPTSGVTSTAVSSSGNNCVVTIVFQATGSTAAIFNPATTVPIFSDDFNGTSLDMSKWMYPDNQGRQGRSAWDSSQVSLDGNGHLVLGITKDPSAAKTYYPSGIDPLTGTALDTNNFVRTGAVQTRGKFENTYGYYVASIKFPQISGTWGGFWLMNDSVYGTGDEGVDGTEIDVLETIGNDVNNGSDTALNWNGYQDDHRVVMQKYTTTDYPTPIFDGQYHTIAVDWAPDHYTFSIDGKVMWQTNGSDIRDATHGDSPGINQNPLYMILSAEGAAYTGALPAGFTHGEMDVDYVKVYDRPPTS